MNDFALPETRYAVNGDVNLAYQVMGDGPVDIILVPGSFHILNSVMNCPAILLFCAASRASLAW